MCNLTLGGSLAGCSGFGESIPPHMEFEGLPSHVQLHCYSYLGVSGVAHVMPCCRKATVLVDELQRMSPQVVAT